MVKRRDNPLALLIDDEPDILALYEMSLLRLGVEAVTALTYADALRLLESGQDFSLCITDLRLPDGNGMDLVHHIQQRSMDLPVAVVTAYGDVQSAVDALKAGAFDFVTKPMSLERLREIAGHALRLSSGVQVKPVAGHQAGSLIGHSPAMQTLRGLIGKVARTQAPVFIHGESGTGKELIARTIHQEGSRAHGPFVPVNCGAIPADLIESELFGHRKGSFTGAVGDKPGLFRAAHGGTLFLDEVADLPLAAQVRLLRVLQERAVRPVGAVEEEPVDVRVLSASHRNLAELVQSGKFRHDLFYRLNVIQLDVPPLREHPEDIPALAGHILKGLALRDGRSVPVLEPLALNALQRHGYPGNVRELENMLERAVAMSEGSEITTTDLRLVNDIDSGVLPTDKVVDASSETILKTLQAHRWNRTRAADALGLTLRQLRYRLGKMGLSSDEDVSKNDH